MKIIIPAIPPSINQFAGRSNVWAYRQEKKKWMWVVRSACNPPNKPIEKALLDITFYFPDNMRRDCDNYIKALLDGLVATGILVDDSWQHCELRLRGAIDRAKPRVEIEVTEV